jgi:hypothetical protein
VQPIDVQEVVRRVVQDMPDDPVRIDDAAIDRDRRFPSLAIPDNAAGMSMSLGSASKGVGVGVPRSLPGCSMAIARRNLMLKRTSRTWSRYSAIDH